MFVASVFVLDIEKKIGNTCEKKVDYQNTTIKKIFLVVKCQIQQSSGLTVNPDVSEKRQKKKQKKKHGTGQCIGGGRRKKMKMMKKFFVTYKSHGPETNNGRSRLSTQGKTWQHG